MQPPLLLVTCGGSAAQKGEVVAPIWRQFTTIIRSIFSYQRYRLRVQAGFITLLRRYMAETLLGAVERSDEEAGAPRRASALRRESIQWQATTAAVRNGLTFKEVFERVHSNDISGIEFDFDSMSAEEKEHLIMRATPLSIATRNFAAQFASSEAGDADFKLSMPVERCDDFLSHAWQTTWIKGSVLPSGNS